MRVKFCLFAALAAASLSYAQAATSLDEGTFKQLVKLEQKYFGRTFDNDTDKARADRLENLIFGEQTQGEPEKRIKKIVSATASEEVPEISENSSPDPSAEKSSPPKAGPPHSNAASHSSSSKGTNHNSTTASSPTPPAAGKSSVAADPYPHIRALEEAIFSKTFVGSPGARLSRLEVQAFGKASSNPDLSDRTDALEDYVEQKLHKKPFGADPYSDSDEVADSGDSSPPGPAPSRSSPAKHGSNASGPENGGGSGEPVADQSDYPRITALESAILGSTYPGQPLPERLNRMETKAFGGPSTEQDLSDRTDKLETYAEKKLHKKPVAVADSDEGDGAADGSERAKQGGGRTKQLLSTLGSSLLGIAGVGPNAFGPAGFGGPAFGGMPGSGFGGIRVRKRSDVMQQEAQSEEDRAPQPPPDDPAVRASSPPPASAKLLTQVGWCEVQMFGHTSPQWHLTERLNQLNNELKFAPGQKGMELMDDAPAMVKAVVARKGKTAAPEIGSKPSPPTR